MRRHVLVGVLALLVAGCGEGTVSTGPASRPFPGQALPAVVQGLSVHDEPSGERAVASVGRTSTVSRAELWSLRRGREVLASLQLSQLKDGLSTKQDAVRAGVRGAVGNGHYRWFKVDDRQWVGVQEQGEVALYLWFPARTDLFVVAQVSAKVTDPDALVGALVSSSKEIAS